MCFPISDKLQYFTVVVCKKAFDAKSRRRSVQIGFHRKVISQKIKKDADAETNKKILCQWGYTGMKI